MIIAAMIANTIARDDFLRGFGLPIEPSAAIAHREHTIESSGKFVPQFAQTSFVVSVIIPRLN
jgi:hypothetical protein